MVHCLQSSQHTQTLEPKPLNHCGSGWSANDWMARAVTAINVHYCVFPPFFGSTVYQCTLGNAKIPVYEASKPVEEEQESLYLQGPSGIAKSSASKDEVSRRTLASPLSLSLSLSLSHLFSNSNCFLRGRSARQVQSFRADSAESELMP